MISHISWADYGTGMALLLALYYSLVLIVYYRGELLQLLKRRASFTPIAAQATGRQIPKSKTVSDSCFQPELFAEEQIPAQTDPAGEVLTMALVGSAIDELKAYLQQAFENKIPKEQLLASVKRILKKYPALINSAFQSMVSLLIEQELQQEGSLSFSAADISGLWTKE